jgi:energy-coupling factor transporter ATP-binding protein EcfA2
MLISVTVENFGSIADAQTLDLRIPKTTPALDRFEPVLGRLPIRLPRVVGFFGPNASGKTTLLRAITSVISFVANSFELAPDAKLPYFVPFGSRLYFDKPTRISVDFDAAWLGGESTKTFRYALEISNQDGLAESVQSEKLYYAEKTRFRRVFERSAKGFVTGDAFGMSSADDRISALRSNSSAIATLARLNHEFSKSIWGDIRNMVSNIQGYQRIGLSYDQILEYYENNVECFEMLKRELSRADLGLSDMNIKVGPRGRFAVFSHNGLNRDIFFGEESHGTQRLVEIFPVLYFALQIGGLAFIDELDADLHPILVQEILRWFQQGKRNPHGAQLFFSAHNASLMDRLEKEEVVFTEKGRDGKTQLFKASDIKDLRREPNLTRKYLGGSLGALPQIG